MENLEKFDFRKIKSHVKKLRKSMTESEKILWKELRGRRLSGFKFLRQHPILYNGNLIRYNYFVADFYCDRKKTIIELDGPIHETTDEYDSFRESELKDLGFHILRIRNEELVELEVVVEKIKSFLFQVPDRK
jgi:very-short-patch-repair endonuclease